MSSGRSSATRVRSFSTSDTAPAVVRRSISSSAAPITVSWRSGMTTWLAGMKSESLKLEVSEARLDQLHEVHRASSYSHARVLEGLDLFGGGSCRPRDDGTRVSHPATWRRRLARDEPHDGFRHVLLHELRRVLLIRAADLAHHRDGFRIGVFLESR